jgi:hypothetical protein
MRYQSDRDRFALPLFEESKALSSYSWDVSEASIRLRRLSEFTDDECEFLANRHLPGVPYAAAPMAS